MLRRSLVVSVILVTCAPAPVATVAAPRSSASPPVAPQATAKSAYPTPPQQQSAPWSSPNSELDATIVAAAKKLFDLGLADPRGLTYGEVELTTGDVWSGGGGVTKTHGWIFPRTTFVVAWNGLVYQAKSVGGPADLDADVRALLDADAAARAKARLDDPRFPYHRFPSNAEADYLATTSPFSIKALLLLRLGRGALAARVWKAAADGSNLAPFALAAGDWAWALYDRGITAHMRGDDALAIESLRRLPDRAKLDGEPRSYAFLADAADVLADDRRRAKQNEDKVDPAALAALAKLPQSERIARLVDALDRVDARQWGQPGGVSLGEDPIVQALIHEGEAAVPALLDAFENDTRYTRSVQFWRDFARSRSVLAVYEAAYVALSGILDASFFEAVSTGDHLTARGLEGRREVGKKLRAYWDKWKGVAPEERLYRTFADDHATPDAWVTAAQKITQQSNVQIVPSSNVFQSSWTTSLPPGQKPTLRGEPLRAKTNPSVTQLFAKRFGATPDARHACGMAVAFAAWDPKAALAPITAFERGTMASYAVASDREFTGSCLSELTTLREAAGDATALPQWATWIVGTKPDDAGYDLARFLAPMVAHPSAAPIVAAGNVLFTAPSPWLPFVGGPASSDRERILSLDLYAIPAFRRHVVALLANRTKLGTITIRGRDSVSVKTATFTSTRGVSPPDPQMPPDGTVMDLRVCDQAAGALGESLHLPPFRIYAYPADRDAALVRIVAALRKR